MQNEMLSNDEVTILKNKKENIQKKVFFKKHTKHTHS